MSSSQINLNVTSSTSSTGQYKTLLVGGIDCFLFGYDLLDNPTIEKQTLSVVFVCHGRMGNSSQMFALCEQIVLESKKSMGSDGSGAALVVAFDQRNHGTRLRDESRNGGWESPTHVLDMYSTQYGTAKDISYLMDMLPCHLGFDPKAFGVVGSSLGGHVTLISMANDKRISFGVSIIGCGSYEELMRHRAFSNTKDKSVAEDLTLGGRLNKQLLDLLSKHDPIHRCQEFKDRPLLLLSGGSDTLVPASCHGKFLEKLNTIYEHKERLQFTIYPKVGHKLTPDMIKDTSNWCSKWAAPTPTSSL